MFLCNTWAFVYDTRQLVKTGWLYFYDAWNLVDWVYIVSGYANIVIQYDWFEQHHHQHLESKSINILFVCFMFVKSFFFLRMYDAFTKIVIMVMSVMHDLQEFLIFYLFIMGMLSLILGILGVGNIDLLPGR